MRRTAIHTIPRTASQGWVFWISSNILFQLPTNVDPDALMPNTSFTWEVTIIRATADVKPEDTGPETKSIRKPERIKWII